MAWIANRGDSMTQLENRQFSYGISGEPAADIYSSALPGEAAHPPQASNDHLLKTSELKKSTIDMFKRGFSTNTVATAISEFSTLYNQILAPLTLCGGQLHILFLGQTRQRVFVETKESYKNRQLTQNFGQTVTRNIVESFPRCLYFSITREQPPTQMGRWSKERQKRIEKTGV
jgi:hypothetical protein